MAARTRVEIDSLRNFANVIEGRIQEYEALNGRMSSMKENVLASWQGEASEAFGEMMANYVVQAGRLVEILTEFKNYAQKAADLFDNADTECAARIRGSF